MALHGGVDMSRVTRWLAPQQKLSTSQFPTTRRSPPPTAASPRPLSPAAKPYPGIPPHSTQNLSSLLCTPPPLKLSTTTPPSRTALVSSAQADAQAKAPPASGSPSPSATPSANSPPFPRPAIGTTKSLPILRLQPGILQAGGLDPSTQPNEALTEFDKTLQQNFLPVNLQYPGLRILNIMPPVFTIRDFLNEEECSKLVGGAEISGLMKSSGVSEHVGKAGAALRTSSTLAMTSIVMKEHALLAEAFQELINHAAHLLPDVRRAVADSRDAGELFKIPSRPNQVSLELPQITQYLKGQFFLEHFDAFPTDVAHSKGYQRRATLLLYLNDVQSGGATNFNSLGFSVQPKQGTAVLFFPSFANGVMDPRMLHTAEEALETKWVSQTWIACGLDKTFSKPRTSGPGASQLPPLVKKKLGSRKKSNRK